DARRPTNDQNGALEYEQELIEAQLAQGMPGLEFQRRLRSASVGSVAAALPPGSALLEFVRYAKYDFRAIAARGDSPWRGERYAGFVLAANHPEKLRLVDLGEASAIDDAVDDFRCEAARVPRADSGGRTTNRGDTGGPALRKLVLAPLLGGVDPGTKLFVAPDGSLALVAFAA